MSFNALFIAHAPDADKTIHRATIKTGMYKLITVCVRNQSEALEICDELVEQEQIDSILLCPGFTHQDVAEIVKATDNKVAVVVARGDGPSGRIVQSAFIRAGYISHGKK
ncbi:hypothetical protein KJ762_10985 [bacterium]|nr:hypothetical protein [bacterium]MBU1063355.1 hypothetical protein [bacterium]MBU1635016.1 hypothetical protein [bacterium]MBU1874009.1 hypothetical protein [bacterium]